MDMDRRKLLTIGTVMGAGIAMGASAALAGTALVSPDTGSRGGENDLDLSLKKYPGLQLTIVTGAVSSGKTSFALSQVRDRPFIFISDDHPQRTAISLREALELRSKYDDLASIVQHVPLVIDTASGFDLFESIEQVDEVARRFKEIIVVSTNRTGWHEYPFAKIRLRQWADVVFNIEINLWPSPVPARLA